MTLISQKNAEGLFGIPFERASVYDSLLQLEDHLDASEFQHLCILDASSAMGFCTELTQVYDTPTTQRKAIGTGKMLYLASLISGKPLTSEIDAKMFFDGVMEMAQDKGRKIYYLSSLPESELQSTHLLSQREFHFSLVGKSTFQAQSGRASLLRIAEDIADSGAGVVVMDGLSAVWDEMLKAHPELLSRVSLVLEYPELKKYTALSYSRLSISLSDHLQRKWNKALQKTGQTANLVSHLVKERFWTREMGRELL